MIRALIVDDEPRARESLATILKKFFPEVEIAGQAEGVNDAFEKIKELNPNLVFLDIKMPDGSGFDLLKKFQKTRFKTIFTTAFGEHALEAIKFSAFDYLLKPIDTQELRDALSKLKEKLDEEEENSVKLSAIFQNLDATRASQKKIVLKTANSIHLVSVSNIVRCEADTNYTWFFFTDQPKLLISKPLKQFEELLEPYGFFRPHQSHLVNMACISRIDKTDGGTLVLNDNTLIPVAVRKREQLFKILENL